MLVSIEKKEYSTGCVLNASETDSSEGLLVQRHTASSFVAEMGTKFRYLARLKVSHLFLVLGRKRQVASIFRKHGNSFRHEMGTGDFYRSVICCPEWSKNLFFRSHFGLKITFC